MTPNEQPALKVNEYEQRAISAQIKRGKTENFEFALLGLFGETGSLLSELKKKQRDANAYRGYAEAVLEELGDTLWYLTVAAHRAGVSLTYLADTVVSGRGLEAKGDSTTFRDLQPGPVAAERNEEFQRTLLALAGEVGLLLTDNQAARLSGNKDASAGRMKPILERLIAAASEAGVTLNAAAAANLTKINDRWPEARIYPPLFDDNFEPFEQLPRDLTIDIFEETFGSNKYVYQRCGDLNIGDRLTDNIDEPDDYRFHDVFHWSYAAKLGWSPVTRALLRTKRKSKSVVDEAQDGARAILLEEGLTAWIFSQAKELEFFEGHSETSFGLLKMVRQFVHGYEANDCPLWLWEEAILDGYRAFRFLKKHRRGRLHVSLASRTIDIEALRR